MRKVRIQGLPGQRAVCIAVLAIGSLSPAWADQLLNTGLSVSYMADDNVTRGAGEGNVLSDQVLNMHLSESMGFLVASHVRFLLNGFAGLDAYQKYQGLSDNYLGAQGEFQYRVSGTFGSPTFGLYGRGWIENYESKLRDSSRYVAGVSARKPLTDKIEMFGAVQYEYRDGNSTVFDTQTVSVRAHLDYQPTRRNSLYLGVEYRDGDFVSTALPSLGYVNIADAIVRDDAFTDNRYAYRINGTAWVGTFGYNFAFGERHSMDLSYRYASARPKNLGDVTVAPSVVEYVVNQITLAYLVRF